MQRGVPLSGLITTAVLVLVIASTGAVGWSGYRASQTTADDLWRQLAHNLAERIATQTQRLLATAPPHAALSAALIEEGALPRDDPDALLRYLEHSLDAHADFSWVSYADAATGTYFAVYRPGDGPEIHRSVRVLVDADTTRFDVDRRATDTWVDHELREGPLYDPRTRPWYTRVADLPSGSGAWVDPYLFSQRRQPGVAYSVPVRDPGGSLLGVYCVDFEMGPLSDFLATLEVGRSGRAYVLTEDGQVVGHPERTLVRATGDALDFYTADTHPDPMLSGAWTAWKAAADPTAPFAFDDTLAVATPFPEGSGVPWVVLTAVPADDLLGTARTQGRWAVATALLTVLCALLLGLLLSRALGQSITALRQELVSVSAFEIFRDPLPSSHIREINDMGQATEVMKQGLRAFARYVPHQLVRHLLSTGREARLGAERRELSVLFSDIEGFTRVVESTEPDIVLAALGAYLDGMNEAIHATGGTVCQYLGDGIMAFWGAPDDVPDHAAQVCRAALQMQAHSDALVARAEATGQPRLPTRIGINSGAVMVGNIGAHERFNYGILGDTVNTAARLEGTNKVYRTRIVAGARTAELAGDAMVFRTLDLVLPRGKRNPVRIYELVAERGGLDPAQERLLDAYARGLDAYAAGRFTEATEAFVEGLAAVPGDGPSAVMVERCRQLIAAPPADWTGVFVLAKK